MNKANLNVPVLQEILFSVFQEDIIVTVRQIARTAAMNLIFAVITIIVFKIIHKLQKRLFSCAVFVIQISVLACHGNFDVVMDIA